MNDCCQCGGTGKRNYYEVPREPGCLNFRASFSTLPDYSPVKTTYICNKCGGSGKFNYHVSCRICQGNGKYTIVKDTQYSEISCEVCSLKKSA